MHAKILRVRPPRASSPLDAHLFRLERLCHLFLPLPLLLVRIRLGHGLCSLCIVIVACACAAQHASEHASERSAALDRLGESSVRDGGRVGGEAQMDRDDWVRVRFGRGGQFRLMRGEDGAHPSEEDALWRGKIVRFQHKRTEPFVRTWECEKKKPGSLFLMVGFRGVPSAVRSCTLTRPGFSQSLGWVFRGCKSEDTQSIHWIAIHAHRINSTEADSVLVDNERKGSVKRTSKTASKPSMRHAFAICSAKGHSSAILALTRRPPSCCGRFLSI